MNVKKKICILRSNPINPDSRVEKEADALVEAGYKVDIFCWDREANHKTELKKIHKDSINLFKSGHKAEYGAGMRSLKPFLEFQFSMVKWIFENGRKYDVFHACDFDTAFFSYFIVRIIRKKFVFDIFDFLYGEPHGIVQRIVKAVQYFLINHADATIICTEKRKKQIAGSNPKQLCIIHNSPDGSVKGDHYSIGIDTQKISVVYVGILQEYRLLRELLTYFERRKDVEFYIGGFGKLEKICVDADKKNSNIHFLGRLSYDKTLDVESQCDIMLAIYDPSIENHRFAAPNKFYEGLMLGKPLIMVRGTGMSYEVEKFGIGVVIDYTINSFNEGLNELIEKRHKWFCMSQTMQRLYKEKYDWDTMKKRLIKLYNGL